MNIRFFFSALIFVACWIGMPAASGAEEGLNVKTVETGSGITALLIEDRSLPMITVKIIFRETGSANDEKGKEGTAVLLAELLDKGAGKLKEKDFQKRLFDNAIDLSFDMSENLFFVSLRTLSENRELAFDLLGQALFKPRFDKDEIKRAKRRQEAAIDKMNESPASLAQQKFMETVYKNSPYGRPVLGTKETVGKITKKDMREFLKNALSKKDMLIAVVGDISPDELSRLLEKTFGALPAYKAADKIKKPEFKAGKNPVFVKSARPQTVIYFGTKAFTRKDPDFPAALLVNQILGGGGLSSRLFNNLRKEKGLTYGASTYFKATPEGLWVGQMATNPKNADEALKELKKEFAKLEKGVSKEELRAAKTYLTGRFDAQFLTHEGRASFLMLLLLHGLEMDYDVDYKNLLNAVSEDDTIRVAKRLLETPLTYVIIGE